MYPVLKKNQTKAPNYNSSFILKRSVTSMITSGVGVRRVHDVYGRGLGWTIELGFYVESIQCEMAFSLTPCQQRDRTKL